MHAILRRSLFASTIVGLGLIGCGGKKIEYKKKLAPTVKVSLPMPGAISKRPSKAGENWTVWGVSYYKRSRVHSQEVEDKTLTVEGYIVKTNLPDAPPCSVHKGGKADPEDCKPPIPTFWLGDKKDSKLDETMMVKGWASNYAQIYDAIKLIEKHEDKAEPVDTFWGKPIPNPLPNVGAKVKVTGRYSTTFTGASSGTEADPIMGILTYEKLEYVEPAPEAATLPGMD